MVHLATYWILSSCFLPSRSYARSMASVCCQLTSETRYSANHLVFSEAVSRHIPWSISSLKQRSVLGVKCPFKNPNAYPLVQGLSEIGPCMGPLWGTLFVSGDGRGGLQPQL